MRNPTTGTLFLIVGPSGAGKDTLIEGVRDDLVRRGSHVFPKRVITRPADAGGEDHEAASPTTFAALRDAGGFSLHWRAHGLCYGVRRAIEDDLKVGRSVVANVSRAVIDQARHCFDPVVVVNVTASPEVLAERLRGRGREDGAAIAARLKRTAAIPTDADSVTLVNEGELGAVVKRFWEILLSKSGEGKTPGQ
jgi:phosphonate metabolism protein PhnN/1,5-bisphosphokinase (PRPP-forming)